eukprot:4163687-Amphidinium_carterae.1
MILLTKNQTTTKSIAIEDKYRDQRSKSMLAVTIVLEKYPCPKLVQWSSKVDNSKHVHLLGYEQLEDAWVAPCLQKETFWDTHNILSTYQVQHFRFYQTPSNHNILTQVAIHLRNGDTLFRWWMKATCCKTEKHSIFDQDTICSNQQILGLGWGNPNGWSLTRRFQDTDNPLQTPPFHCLEGICSRMWCVFEEAIKSIHCQ